MVNPLTHAYFSLRLMEEEGLSQEEEDHLIVGSLLPDIHLSGMIEYHKTHTRSKEFFEYVAEHLHKISALGIVMHAEKPFGIDHYTHKYDGFIQQNSKDVEALAKKYRDSIGKIDMLTVHFLIEYTVDHILARKNPQLIEKVTRAVRNPRMVRVVTAFASFHEMSEKKNKRLIALLGKKQLLKFFENFASPEGTSQNWLSVKFYRELKDEKALPLREKMKRLAKFSYYNIKRKINDEKISQFFTELAELLEPRAVEFLAEVEEKVRPLKNEYWAKIHH